MVSIHIIAHAKQYNQALANLLLAQQFRNSSRACPLTRWRLVTLVEVLFPVQLPSPSFKRTCRQTPQLEYTSLKLCHVANARMPPSVPLCAQLGTLLCPQCLQSVPLRPHVYTFYALRLSAFSFASKAALQHYVPIVLFIDNTCDFLRFGAKGRPTTQPSAEQSVVVVVFLAGLLAV